MVMSQEWNLLIWPVKRELSAIFHDATRNEKTRNFLEAAVSALRVQSNLGISFEPVNHFFKNCFLRHLWFKRLSFRRRDFKEWKNLWQRWVWSPPPQISKKCKMFAVSTVDASREKRDRKPRSKRNQELTCSWSSGKTNVRSQGAPADSTYHWPHNLHMLKPMTPAQLQTLMSLLHWNARCQNTFSVFQPLWHQAFGCFRCFLYRHGLDWIHALLQKSRATHAPCNTTSLWHSTSMASMASGLSIHHPTSPKMRRGMSFPSSQKGATSALMPNFD